MKLGTPQDYFPELDAARRIKLEHRTDGQDVRSARWAFERAMYSAASDSEFMRLHYQYNSWSNDTYEEKKERADLSGKSALKEMQKKNWRHAAGAALKSALENGIHCFPDTSYTVGKYREFGDLTLSLKEHGAECSAEGYQNLKDKYKELREVESGMKEHRFPFFFCILVFLTVLIPMLCLFPGCEHLRISIPEDKRSMVQIIYFLVVAVVMFFSVHIASVPLALIFTVQIGILTNPEKEFDITYLILCSIILAIAVVMLCFSGSLAFGTKTLKQKATAFIRAVDGCALEAHQYFVFINAWCASEFKWPIAEFQALEQEIVTMVKAADYYRMKFRIR